jgi:hypothetical protein
VRRFSVLFLTIGTVLIPLAHASRFAQSGGRGSETSAEASRLEDVEQRLGPFAITGQSFTVVLHEKRLKGAPESHLAHTLTALDIRDQNGVNVYQKVFPVEVAQGKFKQTVRASARLLVGRGDRDGLADSIRRRAPNTHGLLASYTGLLVDYQLYSVSGGSEEAWQVFGYRDGKLALFDKPARTDSPMGNPPAFAVVVGPNGTTQAPIAPSGDVFDFRVWTGNFYVTVPVTVDWGHGKLGPARRCLGMGGNPPGLQEIGCPFRVVAERTPPEADETFLRLLNGQMPNEGQVKHLVLDKKSMIRFLQASAIVDWGLGGDFMQIRLRDLWLQVVVDDDDRKTGWIQTNEDFAAVGLPSRSAAP